MFYLYLETVVNDKLLKLIIRVNITTYNIIKIIINDSCELGKLLKITKIMKIKSWTVKVLR